MVGELMQVLKSIHTPYLEFSHTETVQSWDFATRILRIYYGRGATVQCRKGASAIIAHGLTSERDYGKNLTKVTLSDNITLQLQIQLAGPSKKKLPEEQMPAHYQQICTGNGRFGTQSSLLLAQGWRILAKEQQLNKWFVQARELIKRFRKNRKKYCNNHQRMHRIQGN